MWVRTDGNPSSLLASGESSRCSRDDLQCRGNDGSLSAASNCARAIEKLAAHSVKWTDGALQPKFSHFRWRDKQQGIVTIVGDRAEVQNGFGAFTPVVYECDLAGDDRTVLEVRVTEGRLP